MSNGLPVRDGAAHLYEAAGEALRDAVLPVVLQQLGGNCSPPNNKEFEQRKADVVVLSDHTDTKRN